MVNNFSEISRKAKKREKQKKQKRQMDIYRRRLYKALNKDTTEISEKKPKRYSIAIKKAELAVEAIRNIKEEANNNTGPSFQGTFLALKSYLATRPDGSFQWDKNMEQLVETIVATKSETLWHRDILFKYFLTMEQLQENMKEYQELTNLAALALCNLHDT